VMKMAPQASALTTRLFPQPTHCCAHRGRIALQCPAGGCTADRYGTQRRSVLLQASASETPVKVENEIDNFPTEMCRAALCGGMDLEQEQEIEAEVIGNIPSWVKGSLLMNGAAYVEGMKHMFSGFAVVHKWQIEGGNVHSSHKFLQTEAYKHYRNTGKLRYSEFGTYPPMDGIGGWLRPISDVLKQSVLGLMGSSDNASVNIIRLGTGKLMAVSEGTFSHYLLDPDNIAIGAQLPLHPDVKADMTTAHHFVCSNGDVLNLATKVGEGFNIYRLDSSNLKYSCLRTVPARSPMSPSWIHDFPATDEYVVVVEQPLHFNTEALLFGAEAEYGFFDWRPESTLLHLVPVDTSKKVHTFVAPPFFAFHYGNTFVSEDGSKLCFDVSLYKDPEIINDLSLDKLRAGRNDVSGSSLWRFELPLNENIDGAEVSGKPLATSVEYFDFPAINAAYKGKEHRYVYGITTVRPTSHANALMKLDTVTGSTAIWHDAGCCTGEPHFIPHPSPKGEDHGVVVSQVLGADGHSFLVFLDGQSFKEVARAKLPYAMPARFHGEFIPA